jgi:hypothetical protein
VLFVSTITIEEMKKERIKRRNTIDSPKLKLTHTHRSTSRHSMNRGNDALSDRKI